MIYQKDSKRNGGYSRVLKAGFRTGAMPYGSNRISRSNIEAKKIDKPKKVETKEKRTLETTKAATK